MDKMKKIKHHLAEVVLLKKKSIYDYMFSSRYQYKFYKYQDKKKIILTLIPTHDNLGDHAIAYAGKKYLVENFPDYEVIEVNISDIYRYAKAIKNSMSKEDLVFIIGGGNMGDLYRNEEWTRRFILKVFDKFKVINLPATAHFTNTFIGKKELEKSKKIYNSHPNYTIIARDESSYKFMKEHFHSCTIIKKPDIALYLNEKDKIDRKRKGIKLCLRQDIESFLNESSKEEIKKAIKLKYGSYTMFTTTVGYRVNNETREKELKKIWDELREAELVITDRLHGMIFCAITGTPCVVIRSFDHKVMEGYKWLEGLNYMSLVSEPTKVNVLKEVETLIGLKEMKDYDFKERYFSDFHSKIIY